MKSCPIPALLALMALLTIGDLRAQSPVVPNLNVLETFESYADTNALSAVWSNLVGSAVVGLETNIVCQGNQSLRLRYSVAGSPGTNTIVRTFAAPQDWSTFNTINLTYGSALGNSTDNIFVLLRDHLGGPLGGFVITAGTTTPPCRDVALDMVNHAPFTNTINRTDLHDVTSIVLGVVAGSSHGTGTVYFDNLVAGNNGNIITNPGFRDLNNNGTFGDGWTSFGVQLFQNFAANGNPGHVTFFSDINGNTGGVYGATSPVVPGAKYRFNVDFNSEANWHATTYFGVQFFDTNNVVVTQKLARVGFLDAPKSYKTYSMIIHAPPDAVSARPWISYGDSWRETGASQRAMFDNVTLAVETNRVLSIFGASIHKGLDTSAVAINYTVNGGWGHSFGPLLNTLMSPNGWRVVNQSIPGDDTTRLTARFYRDEFPVCPDISFIGLSMGNEGLPGATNPAAVFNHFYTGITNLIAMARSNNYLVMIGCGFPRTAYTTNEYVWLKKMDLLLNTLDVPSVNFIGVSDNGTGNMLPLHNSGDGIHFTDVGHLELYLAFVPSVFDALMAGKPTPRWSNNRSFARIIADPQQSAPLNFTPSSTVHSFSTSFRVRTVHKGTIAAITLAGSTNMPTLEIQGDGLTYVAADGQTISSTLPIADGAWHEVLFAHQYSRTQSWLYVDSVLAGNVVERLAPTSFVLGGPGNATGRPGSPESADYENWFIHRSALTIDEVQAQFQGALQQSSLELYAPLDDAAFAPGGSVTNCAQSLSTATVTSSNICSQAIEPIVPTPAGVRLTFFGTPNRPYEIQRSDGSEFSTYSVVLNSTSAPVNGVISFCDTNPLPSSSFYRLKQN